MSFADKKDTGNWNEWSEFIEANVLISVDPKKDLITVNSTEVQSFKIKSYGEIQTIICSAYNRDGTVDLLYRSNVLQLPKLYCQ